MSVVAFIMLITLITLAGAVAVAVFGPSDSDSAKTAADNLWKAFFSGFSGLAGLLGGKAL